MEHDDRQTAPESPSRSARKREAQAVHDLAAKLVAMPPSELARADLPADVRSEIDNVRGITARVAHKRQLGFLAKLLRRCDPDVLASAHALVGDQREQRHREAAALHRLESLRERLIEQGDDALAELADAHPGLDTQHLRSLIRQARRERDKAGPPHAARELFRQLRALQD